MANVSAEDAQTFSVCQFCKESSEIKWKCINCDLFLCQFCNSRLHSRIAIFNEHIVFNLKDCGSEDAVEASRKVDLDNLPCTIHSDQKCVLYCKDCDKSVCLDCLVEGHQNHKYCKLEKVYQEKLKNIKDMKNKIESGFPHFKEKEEHLQQILMEGDKQYTKNRQKIIEIKERTLEMKDNIIKYADGLLSDLDKQWKPTKDQCRKELNSVRQRKDGLLKRKSQLDQTLCSPSASGIFVTSNSLDKSMPDKTVKYSELKGRIFLAGKIPNKPISVLFGSVYEIPDIQLLKTYKTNLSNVSKLIKCDGNSVFIGRVNGLQKIKLLRSLRLRVLYEKESKLVVYDMTLMDNGDLLVSSKEQDLKLYTKDGRIKIFKSFNPIHTLGVHMNQEKEIFVGISDSADLSRLKADSESRVVKLSQKGDILHTFEYGSQNQRLFKWPHRICTKNNFIYVIDCFSNILYGQGRVVVIDRWGKLQWTNNGCSDNFYPGDIAVTCTNMVIVTDWNNHTINILSLFGEIIVSKVVSDLGIQNPYSISIDKDETLWIGNLDSTTKIHALKLT